MPSERVKTIPKPQAVEEDLASLDETERLRQENNEALEQLELLTIANERLQDDADHNKHLATQLARENEALKKELAKTKQQHSSNDPLTTFLRNNHELDQTVPIPYHLEEKKKLEAEIAKLTNELKSVKKELASSEADQKEFQNLNVQWLLLVKDTKEVNAGLEKKVTDVEFQNKKLLRTIEQLEAKIKKHMTERPRFITSSSQNTPRSTSVMRSSRSTPPSSLFTTPKRSPGMSATISPQSSDLEPPKKIR